jgi:hypothetical protein
MGKNKWQAGHVRFFFISAGHVLCCTSICDIINHALFVSSLIITKNGIMHLKTASLHISNHTQCKRKETAHPIACSFSNQDKKKIIHHWLVATICITYCLQFFKSRQKEIEYITG